MKTIHQTNGTVTRKNFRFFILFLISGTLLTLMLSLRVHAQTLAMAATGHDAERNSKNMKSEDSFSRGVQAVSEKDDQTAIACFTKALGEQQQKGQILDMRGCAYARLNQYKKAMADFTCAIAEDSTKADYFYHRALAANKAGKYASCIVDCSTAIRLNPAFAEAYLVRGLAIALDGDSPGSMQDFKSALLHKPDYAEAYYNIGLNYYDAGDHVNARKYLKEAKQLGFENPELAAYMNE